MGFQVEEIFNGLFSDSCFDRTLLGGKINRLKYQLIYFYCIAERKKIKQIQIVNPLEITDWNHLILEHKVYSFFHSREWAKVLHDSYGYKPVYFSIFNNDKICSLVPAMQISSFITGRRLVSLPFSDFCDPFFHTIEDSGLLQKEVIAYSKKNKLDYIEFRSSDTKFPFEPIEFRTDLRHILLLQKDENKILKSFSDNTKRNIKKANRENVQVVIKNDVKGLKIFYEMTCETRQKHGLPPQPYSFFSTIYRNIIGKSIGDILLARHNDNYIAGAMYFKIGKKILYKFGASFSKYQNLRGNHLVMWEAIRKYTNEGYEEFDFGRTEINHEGLRRFKLGFNTEERLIYTSRYDLKSQSFISSETKTHGFYNHLFNKTPIFILKIIGNTFYRHIG